VSSREDLNWGVTAQVRLLDNIYVRIENRGDKPVYVRWDESAYIDVGQQSHAVELVVPRGGVAKSYSVLAPGTHVEEQLRPVSSGISQVEDPLLAPPAKGGWRLWGSGLKGLHIGAEVERGDPLLGKEVGFFFVLEREGVKKEVITKFRLTGEVARL
jgi:hypothetical protein